MSGRHRAPDEPWVLGWRWHAPVIIISLTGRTVAELTLTRHDGTQPRRIGGGAS